MWKIVRFVYIDVQRVESPKRKGLNRMRKRETLRSAVRFLKELKRKEREKKK